ncbi:MFS transporter, partial [Burkholderia multivorans]
AAPGLFALVLFTTLNNLVGGVYMALMDPYGIEVFGTVQTWGIALAVVSTGFMVGGALVAKFGLGRNPIRTMLLLCCLIGALGAVFAIREAWLLYGLGMLG